MDEYERFLSACGSPAKHHAAAAPPPKAPALPELDTEAMAQRLRDARGNRELRQVDLIALAGVPQSTIGHWETGAAAPPLWALVRVAYVLGMNVSDLIVTKGQS